MVWYDNSIFETILKILIFSRNRAHKGHRWIHIRRTSRSFSKAQLITTYASKASRVSFERTAKSYRISFRNTSPSNMGQKDILPILAQTTTHTISLLKTAIKRNDAARTNTIRYLRPSFPERKPFPDHNGIINTHTRIHVYIKQSSILVFWKSAERFPLESGSSPGHGNRSVLTWSYCVALAFQPSGFIYLSKYLPAGFVRQFQAKRAALTVPLAPVRAPITRFRLRVKFVVGPDRNLAFEINWNRSFFLGIVVFALRGSPFRLYDGQFVLSFHDDVSLCRRCVRPVVCSKRSLIV